MRLIHCRVLPYLKPLLLPVKWHPLALEQICNYSNGNQKTGGLLEYRYRMCPVLHTLRAAPTRAILEDRGALAALFAILQDVAEAHPMLRSCPCRN